MNTYNKSPHFSRKQKIFYFFQVLLLDNQLCLILIIKKNYFHLCSYHNHSVLLFKILFHFFFFNCFNLMYIFYSLKCKCNRSLVGSECVDLLDMRPRFPNPGQQNEIKKKNNISLATFFF